MKLFDSLVHATPDGHWISKIAIPATVENLIQDMDRGGVARACLVAIDGVVDSDFVRQAAFLHPDRLVPVAGYNPLKAASPHHTFTEINDLADRGFKGLKLHPRFNRYDPLADCCLEAIRAAGQVGLVVFIDTLFDYVPSTPIRHPEDVARVLGYSFPQTTIILLHGGGSRILNLFDPVRQYKNLILDLSFTLFRYRESSVDLDLQFLFKNLEQRLVIGSDFPEYLPSQLRSRLNELANMLPDEKLERVLFRNLDQSFGFE